MALDVAEHLVGARQLLAKLSLAEAARGHGLEYSRGLAEVGLGLARLAELGQHLAEGLVASRQVSSRVDVVRVGLHEALADLQRLAIALRRTLRVTQVGCVGIPLNVAHLQVGLDQLLLEAAVAAGLLRQLAEVLERPLDQQMAGRSGSRQILDRPIELEQERCRQPANVVELPLGLRPLRAGHACLPGGCKNSRDEQNHDQRRRRRSRPVPADELPRPIVPGVPMRRRTDTGRQLPSARCTEGCTQMRSCRRYWGRRWDRCQTAAGRWLLPVGND